MKLKFYSAAIFSSNMELFNLRFSYFIVAFFFIFVKNSISQSIEYLTNSETVNQYVQDLIGSKESYEGLPYRKFQDTFSQLSICGLRYRAKDLLCKTILTGPRYGYIFKGPEDAYISCETMTVVIGTSENGLPVTEELTGYKCPMPTRVEKVIIDTEYDNFKRELSPVSYYFSIGTKSSLALMYYSHFSISANQKPDIAVTKFPVQQFWEMEQESRMEAYAPQPERVFSEFTGLGMYRNMGSDSMVIRQPYSVEKTVCNYLKNVQMNQSPYTKFTITYTSLNVCGIKLQKRQQYCTEALGNMLYGFQVATDPILAPCQRRAIYFEFYSEGPRAISTINCILKENSSMNVYYLSAIGRPTALIIYMQVLPHVEILPDAAFYRDRIIQVEDEGR